MIKNILFLFVLFLLLPGFSYGQNAPVADFKASTDSICGNTLTDNFTDLSSNHPSAWKWYFPGATPDTSTLQNPANIMYPGYGCYNVTEVVRNNNGSDSITRNNYICLDEMPKITITGNDICQGGSDTITITATGGTSGYRWSTGATTSSITLNFVGIVNITYSIGLASGACYEDTFITVKVDTNPVTFFKGDTSICVGDSTVIYAVSAGHSGYGYSYLWSTGSTADSIIVLGKTPGTYVYYLTVSKGACTKDSAEIAVKVHVCTGVENYTASSGLQIFPNPAGNELFFNCPRLYNKDALITIVDVTGRIVKTETMQVIQSNRAITISDLAPAVYFMRIQSSEGVFMQKFVKD